MGLKIKIMSDNHIDRLNSTGLDLFIESNKNTEDVADVLVIAGDWCNGFNLNMFKILVDIASQYKYCLYVLGNHDYYGEIIRNQFDLSTWLDMNFPTHNIIVLDNKVITIETQRFVGSTLWSYIPHQHSFMIRNRINDYKVIKYSNDGMYGKLTPDDTNEFFRSNVYFLNHNVQLGDVVITHHLPSFQSVHDEYRGNDSNCAFASDLDDLIIDRRPSIWIHGHTHKSCDYMIGNTRVVCNPMGYNYENENYNPNFII